MPFEVFISYASQDKSLCEELEKHLAVLRRQQLITHWHEGEISPGTNTEQQIREHLNTAHLILLLISPDFLASDLCYSMQMQQAMTRHEQGQAHVLPILLRRVYYQGAPFAKLQPLPRNGEPITAWPSRDDAWTEVVEEISRLLAKAAPDPVLAGDDKQFPFPRNPYFTGREELLTQLHKTFLSTKHAALPQAISGLGGIGKTQTALEYAYRYADDYHALFWLRAATQEELITDLLALAERFHLPRQDTQDQHITLMAVKRWFETHTNWLLILDNADDLTWLPAYLPSTTKGHILLTTRASTTRPLAQRVEIHKMGLEEGTVFLLHRAGLLALDAPLEHASSTEQALARTLVSEMDGLPLALDQAGAYIEETRSNLSRFLTLYRQQRSTILKRRGGIAADHPPVAATWSLSFQKVEQTSPASTDLLRLCAFLAPDAIPEELFTEGADELGPHLQSVAPNPSAWDLALKALLDYSLLQRNPRSETLTVHRLVQAILKDDMDEQTQRLWAERAIKAIYRAFPAVTHETRFSSDRLLPHAQACAALITDYDFTFPEAARLLNQTGVALEGRASYSDAIPLLQRALSIREKVLGPDHPDTALSLNNLAYLYRSQGNYPAALSLYQRALSINEKVLGPDHPNTAIVRGNYAFLQERTTAPPNAQKSVTP